MRDCWRVLRTTTCLEALLAAGGELGGNREEFQKLAFGIGLRGGAAIQQIPGKFGELLAHVGRRFDDGSRRHGAIHALIVVRKRLGHLEAQDLFHLLLGEQRLPLASVQDDGHARVQIEGAEVVHLFARQMQRWNLRRANQQDALAILHDLERVTLQVARKIESTAPDSCGA